MKRLFFQTKMYDYTTKVEAKKHLEEMFNKGWRPLNRNNPTVTYYSSFDSIVVDLGQDFVYRWSIEYYKES